MKILVTGAKGFVGRNLCAALKNLKDGKDRTRPELSIDEIFEYDIDSDPANLDAYCRDCDFVVNLAGVNRPQNTDEFMQGNFGFASTLLNTLKEHGNKAPVLNSSSIQAELDNDYGRSKKAGEDLIFRYGKENDVKVLVYRLPNLFGKWCRPNYNSVIATFCNNIANDLPIKVNDASVLLTLVYIDDLVCEILDAIEGKEHRNGDFCYVPITYKITLGEIVDLLYSFNKQSETLIIPEIQNDSFAKKLYSTYLSYLPKEKVAFDLKMNCDERGSFTEIIRTMDRGQFSVNVSKPGITKGNHWHHTKNEKFLVVSGHGLIQMRQTGTDKIVNFEVSGRRLQVVDMIPGWTHNIINLSDTDDLVTFMWCNELFDPLKPDTFFEKV